MKQMKYLLCLLAVILAANSLHAQGLGFYLGGKRVELTEGDSINFTKFLFQRRAVKCVSECFQK